MNWLEQSGMKKKKMKYNCCHVTNDENNNRIYGEHTSKAVGRKTILSNGRLQSSKTTLQVHPH